MDAFAIFEQTRIRLFVCLFVSVNLQLSQTIRLFASNLGSSFRVAGLHFHWGQVDDEGSEHTVDEDQYPLEVGG